MLSRGGGGRCLRARDIPRSPLFSPSLFCCWQESQSWHFCIHSFWQACFKDHNHVLVKNIHAFYKKYGTLFAFASKQKLRKIQLGIFCSLFSTMILCSGGLQRSEYLLFPLYQLAFCPWHCLQPEECMVFLKTYPFLQKRKCCSAMEGVG